MHEHERELIAALAEGSLEDETEARALLETSPQARAEYRLQLDALAALEETSPAEMTEAERAQLHRDLWTQLRAEKVKGRFTAGIYGWSLVAATVFVVVGLAAVLGGGMLTGQQAAALEEISSDLAADDTVNEETERTFAAADEAGGAPAMSAEARDYFDRIAERIRADQAASEASDGDAGIWARCLEEAGLDDHRVIEVVEASDTAPVTGRYLAAVRSGEPVGSATPIDFVDSGPCKLVHTSV